MDGEKEIHIACDKQQMQSHSHVFIITFFHFYVGVEHMNTGQGDTFMSFHQNILTIYPVQL